MARLDKENPQGDKPEPAASPGGVAALLRQTREARGEDLRSVADALRIRHAYLVAIEDGRHHELPGPTYAVGFVRAYAEHLGLDPLEIARRYKAEGAVQTGGGALEFPVPVSEATLPTKTILLVSAIAALLAYGGWTLTNGGQRPVAEVVEELPDRLSALLSSRPGTTPETPATPASPAAAPEPSAQQTSVPPMPAETAPAETAPAGPTPTTPPAAAPPAAEPAQTATAPTPAPTPAAPTPAPAPAAASSQPATGAPLAEGNPLAQLPSYPQTAGAAGEPMPPGDDQAAAEGSPPPETEETTPGAEAPALTAEASAPTPAPASAPAPAPAPTPAPAPLPVAETAPVLPSTPPAAPPPAAPPDAAPPPADLAGMPDGRVFGEENLNARVLLRARADAWVQVRDGEELLLTRLMKRGDTYRVPNRRGLTLMTGNAGGVVVLVDGQPTPPLGRSGDVMRGISLDPETLKAAAAGTN